MNKHCPVLVSSIAILFAAGASPALRSGELESNAMRYVSAVRQFADTVLEKGRDRFGERRTPLFVDGLHAKALTPARWKYRGETWVLSNFASQQPLLRTLDGLTVLTADPKYREAAEDAARYALQNLQSPNGLLFWGGHAAWDLLSDRPVGQYGDRIHELKGHQPDYRLMWRVDPGATRRLIEAIWATHILDWSTLDYNRHADTRKKREPRWNVSFRHDMKIPFATQGSNLSFVNVVPPLVHSGVSLAVLGEDARALEWTRRLVFRWQQGRHPKTGLCGGQLSYRKHDRAQDALGHVHPAINEAEIVASYHQTCRYHQLPLVQMQAAEALIAAGGRSAEVGEELVLWAAADLKAYAAHSWDREAGHFVAMMIDGTPLRWQEARTGYYVPQSFAPRKPDGLVLWGYALAYRLTKDRAHWDMARDLAIRLDLGDIGRPATVDRTLRTDTPQQSWRLIYALLELHRASGDRAFLRVAGRIADNILTLQADSGLFPRRGREFARTGDEAPLALLHLAAAIRGKRASMPPAVYDSRFFHCEYDGELRDAQKKRADKRTYDHLVFYGE